MSLHIAVPSRAPLAMAAARPVSLRRLASFSPLTLSDEALVKRLKPRTLPAESVLSDSHAHEADSWIILSGWAARVRAMPDGRRQTVSMLLPGDPVNLSTGRWAGDRLPVIALTPVIAADAEPLRSMLRTSQPEHAGIARACERAMWCEQVYCLNAIVRLGQQTAYERLAHLLLEIHDRLETVGLANASRFQMPVTQDVIAHALGLSLVHLSRTLRQMRKEGSIALRPGHVEILRRDVLAAAANFPHTAAWPGQHPAN